MGIGALFNAVLYQPLLNFLLLLYVYLPGHDFGVAVIVLTLIIKIILFPVSQKGIRSQKALSALQPKIKEIQEKYKGEKEKQSRAMMELYQKSKINPLSGCLPLLLQLPILLALYQVFLKGLDAATLKASLYRFIPYPAAMNFTFLGIVNLAHPNIFIALLAGLFQYFQSKISLVKNISPSSPKKGGFSSALQNQMTYLLPFFTVFIVWKFGSIIGLYWIANTLFSIGEYYIISKKYGEEKGGIKAHN